MKGGPSHKKKRGDLQGGRKFKEIPKELLGIKYKPESE